MDLVLHLLRAERGQRQRVLAAVTTHAASLLGLVALSQSDAVVDKVSGCLWLRSTTVFSPDLLFGF